MRKVAAKERQVADGHRAEKSVGVLFEVGKVSSFGMVCTHHA